MSSSISKKKELKFLLDENVKRELLEFLKEQKFDVVLKSKGSSNGDLAEFSKLEKRVLITNDRHFTDSEQFPKKRIFSVVWLKLPQNKIDSLIESFSSLLKEKTTPGDFEGKLITLKEDGFEISELPT